MKTSSEQFVDDLSDIDFILGNLYFGEDVYVDIVCLVNMKLDVERKIYQELIAHGGRIGFPEFLVRSENDRTYRK